MYIKRFDEIGMSLAIVDCICAVMIMKCKQIIALRAYFTSNFLSDYLIINL